MQPRQRPIDRTVAQAVTRIGVAVRARPGSAPPSSKRVARVARSGRPMPCATGRRPLPTPRPAGRRGRPERSRRRPPDCTDVTEQGHPVVSRWTVATQRPIWRHPATGRRRVARRDVARLPADHGAGRCRARDLVAGSGASLDPGGAAARAAISRASCHVVDLDPARARLQAQQQAPGQPRGADCAIRVGEHVGAPRAINGRYSVQRSSWRRSPRCDPRRSARGRCTTPSDPGGGEALRVRSGTLVLARVPSPTRSPSRRRRDDGHQPGSA